MNLTAPPPPHFAPPAFVSGPSPAEMTAAQPSDALPTRLVEAVLRCRVETTGVLTNCLIARETSEGVGAAALKLVDRFTYKPALRDNVAVASEAFVPVIFYQPTFYFATRTFTWTSASSGLMERYYPKRALRKSIAGVVRLSCIADSEGSAPQCLVQDAEPAEYGFGEAGLQVIQHYSVLPTQGIGEPFFGIYARTIMFVPVR